MLTTALILGCPADRMQSGQGTDLPDTDAAGAIAALLEGRAAPRRPLEASVRPALLALYAPETTPVWTHGGRPTAAASAAVRLLADAASEGLDPADYDAGWLGETLAGLSARQGVAAPDPALFDVTLSVESVRHLRAVHAGRVRPTDAGFAYHVDFDDALVGGRLRGALTGGDIEALRADLEPRYAQYARLKRALAVERGALPDSRTRDRVRKIELALERVRWLPHAPVGPFIVANVPAFRLAAFDSGAAPRPALQMAIVVGRAARTQTPLFVDEITHVLFRPAWYPPPSILRGEIAPRLARDPGYLRREQMDIVAATTDSSPALAATAANLQRLRAGSLFLRQRPGRHNSLGLVKFVFPNDYRVYMHDTPARSLFKRERRDFSHGCIRVEAPAALAGFVLSGQPGWTAERIAAATEGTRTQRADVVPPIPVFVFYTTAIVRADETVEFYDDLYGLDARLERALAAEAR